MAFAPEILKQIIEANSVSYRRKGRSYVFECPKCKKKDKLWLREYDGRFICFVCAESDRFKGRCEYALVELFGGSIGEYVHLLYGGDSTPIAHIELDLVDHFGENEAEFSVARQHIGYEWPFQFVDHTHKAFKKGQEYLASRGITMDIIQKYDIRYSPQDNRVIFPYVIDGELVGWQGRICGPTERIDSATGRTFTVPKALTTLQDDIQAHYVMFGDNLTTSAHCVLAEGPMDALKADLCGGNVASLGKGVTYSQLCFIADRVKRLYIALDPDAGPEIMRISKEAYALGLEVYLMVPPEERDDFGDCTPEEALGAFKTAKRMHPNMLVVNLGSQLVF
jgi:hypothetical protein